MIKKLNSKIRKMRRLKDTGYLMRLIFQDQRFRELIIKLNTEDQLYNKGIDSLGRLLGYYSENTIFGIPGKFEGKADKGQRYDHITLNDTGDFYESFRVRLEGKDIKIDADDQGKGLFLDYGEDILGLTPENMQRVIDAAKLVLVPKLRDYLLKQAA